MISKQAHKYTHTLYYTTLHYTTVHHIHHTIHILHYITHTHTIHYIHYTTYTTLRTLNYTPYTYYTIPRTHVHTHVHTDTQTHILTHKHTHTHTTHIQYTHTHTHTTLNTHYIKHTLQTHTIASANIECYTRLFFMSIASHSFRDVLVYRNGYQFRAGINITISEFDNCRHMKGAVVIVATKHKTTRKGPVWLVLSQNNYQYILA